MASSVRSLMRSNASAYSGREARSHFLMVTSVSSYCFSVLSEGDCAQRLPRYTALPLGVTLFLPRGATVEVEVDAAEAAAAAELELDAPALALELAALVLGGKVGAGGPVVAWALGLRVREGAEDVPLVFLRLGAGTLEGAATAAGAAAGGAAAGAAAVPREALALVDVPAAFRFPRTAGCRRLLPLADDAFAAPAAAFPAVEEEEEEDASAG